MTRLLLAICASVAVGSLAGIGHFVRWLNAERAGVPSYVPDYLVEMYARD